MKDCQIFLKKLNLINEEYTILDAIEELKLVKSRSEIKRLIKSDGVKVNNKLYKNSNLSLKEFSELKEIKIELEKENWNFKNCLNFYSVREFSKKSFIFPFKTSFTFEVS